MSVSTNPQDHITHCNEKMLDELGWRKYADWPGESPSKHVRAFFRLSPEAKVVIDPDFRAKPALFMAAAYWSDLPGRQHVVVAREHGDLEWPAYLGSVRKRHVGEGQAFVRQLAEPFWEALHAAQVRLGLRKPDA